MTSEQKELDKIVLRDQVQKHISAIYQLVDNKRVEKKLHELERELRNI